jgi:hypothetical protein
VRFDGVQRLRCVPLCGFPALTALANGQGMSAEH